MQETQVQSLGREDPLEKEMANHSSILAWKTVDREAWPATVDGIARMGHKPPPQPGDSEGQESLMCCSPWGQKESDTTQQQEPRPYLP